MTREEAINIISQMIKDEEGFLSDNTVEAHKMAIKALEQEPCEDCVSRAYIEPIVEELENICINGNEHILSLLSDIKNAPPVIPQPKTGRWVEMNVRGSKYPYCSECGNGLDVIYHYPFCPNCGAKMICEVLE